MSSVTASKAAGAFVKNKQQHLDFTAPKSSGQGSLGHIFCRNPNLMIATDQVQQRKALQLVQHSINPSNRIFVFDSKLIQSWIVNARRRVAPSVSG